jgi:tetratricopeptide (TPR) repeat protein
MEQINYYEENQSVLEHLDKRETGVALEKAKILVDKFPEEALPLFSMGLCYHQKEDIFHAIECFTKALMLDPAFISAAEMLLKLNKDNYSLGELKYIYSLIIAYKDGTDEMYKFVEKFSDVPLAPNLSIPNFGQDDMNKANLPAKDENAYIRHLINEMDKPEEMARTEAPPRKELSIIPEQEFTPPPKKNIPVRNNKNDNSTQYGIETMTMAKLYIRQGLYRQALGILNKLRERDPDSVLIKEEIQKVTQLLNDMKE